MDKCAIVSSAHDGKTQGFCIVRSIDIKKSAAGSPYLDMSLGDKYGEVRSKLWDYKADVHGVYHMGDVIKVQGRLSTWQGSEQLTVDKIRLVRPEDNAPLDELVPSAPETSEAMFKRLEDIAKGFEDADYRTLTLSLLNKYKTLILVYPAALRLHHAMRGGLLYHTGTLVSLAEGILKVYPELDRELLLTGTILHDIAKVREYELAQSGLASGYSARGQLLGHLVMGAEWVSEAAKENGVDPEKAMLVEHMLISHHGEPEYGAAKLPMFPEAEVLSEVDMLDAKLFNMFNELQSVPVGEFSQPVWSLDKRRLYHHDPNALRVDAVSPSEKTE